MAADWAPELLSSASKNSVATSGTWLILVVVGLSLILGACGLNASTTTDSNRFIASVVDPVDGDTLVVRLNGKRENIRLIGVDTPETKHPNKPIECGGPEASTFTATQFPRGTKIEIVRDIEPRDRFGRLLAYVFRLSDGMFLNRALIENGFGAAYPFEPNTMFSLEFASLELLAQNNSVGMWAYCRR